MHARSIHLTGWLTLFLSLLVGCKQGDASIGYANACMEHLQRSEFVSAIEVGVSALAVDKGNTKAKDCVEEAKNELLVQGALADAARLLAREQFEAAYFHLFGLFDRTKEPSAVLALAQLTERLMPADVRQKQSATIADFQDAIIRWKDSLPSVPSLDQDIPSVQQKKIEASPEVQAAAESEVKVEIKRFEVQDVLKVFSRNRKKIEPCIELARREGMLLDEPLVLALALDPDGRLSDMWTATAKYRKTKLLRCTRREVLKWVFPSFSGPRQRLDIPVEVAP